MERTSGVIVVGAGAAGLLAAIVAARGGAKVTVVETRPKPGAKIRVSGGGRCNVLPSHVEPADFHTAGSMHSVRNVLGSWPLSEVRSFFENDLGIALKTEVTGKVFPRSDDARDVVKALLRALHASGAVLRAPFRAARIDRLGDGGFEVVSGDGEALSASRLVLATGGLSLPKTGSDGFGFGIAARWGHTIVPTYPALVPLLTGHRQWHELAGVSVPVGITAWRGNSLLAQHEGHLLFTHRGFSGPAILDASHHVTAPGQHDVLRVRWGGCAGPDWKALLRRGGRMTVGGLLGRHLPSRLATQLAIEARVEAGRRVGDLRRDERSCLVETLERFPLPIEGHQGYRVAEVTGGGIPLSQTRTATLESRLVPGTYFCGEILDVTGRLGGYNFLWAWITGCKVGRALARTASS